METEENVDRSLLDRLKESDQEAFRLLFERYQPVLFRRALFQTRDADTAHEAVQETFVRIWERRTRLKPDLSFLAYALRICGNIVRDMARHRTMRERVASSIPPPTPAEGDDPSEALALRLLEERLAAIVTEKLPERCRTIFLLSRFEGKTHGEIAVLLGLSPKTVENQINRALKLIRRHLT